MATKRESEKVIKCDFACEFCNLTETEVLYGHCPRFLCDQIKFKAKSFIMKDPFSEEKTNFLLLGGKCCFCSKVMCQACGTFFGKEWICSMCKKHNF